MMNRPTTIKEYAEKWGRNEDANFAVGCFDDNTIEELVNGLNELEPDETDMKNYEIENVEEWYDAIYAALCERSSDYGAYMLYKLNVGDYVTNYDCNGYARVEELPNGDMFYVHCDCLDDDASVSIVADMDVDYISSANKRRI